MAGFGLRDLEPFAALLIRRPLVVVVVALFVGDGCGDDPQSDNTNGTESVSNLKSFRLGLAKF